MMPFLLLTSDQARLPAEFKDINYAEEKKLTRIPLVMVNEEGTAQLENLRCVATANSSFEKYFPGAIGLA